MEPKPHEEPYQAPPPTPSTEVDSSSPPATGNNSCEKRKHSPDVVEQACERLDQPEPDAAEASSAHPKKKARKSRHSAFMWSGSSPHKGWEPSYVAMAKCDLCSRSSRGVVQKCDECKLTVCKDCYDAGEMESDPVHRIEAGSLNWEIPKKIKTTPPKTERQRLRARQRRTRGTSRRGGPSKSVSFRNPVSCAIDVIGDSEQPPLEEEGTVPFASRRQVREEEDDHDEVENTSFRPIEPRPDTNFWFRQPYAHSQVQRPALQSESGVPSGIMPLRNLNMGGYRPAFRPGPAESPHPNDGNNQPRGLRPNIEPRERLDMRREADAPRQGPVVYQSGNDHPHHRQMGSRVYNDLEAHSLAAQNNHRFPGSAQNAAAPPSGRPGVNLPPLNVAIGNLPPRLPPSAALNPMYNTPAGPQPAEQARPRSYLGGPPPASNPSPLPEPVHPQYNYESLASTRVSDWGPDFVRRSLRTNRDLPNWSLDLCLRHEITRTWERGDLQWQTKDERAAFQVLLGATYHAAAILGLDMEKNVARQWLCEQEKKMMEQGMSPLCILE